MEKWDKETDSQGGREREREKDRGGDGEKGQGNSQLGGREREKERAEVQMENCVTPGDFYTLDPIGALDQIQTPLLTVSLFFYI